MDKEPNSWDIIKAEYITGECSCQFLSEKYDISPRTMQDRCKKEGWVKARKAYRKTVVDKMVKMTAKKDAECLSQLRTAAMSISGAIEKIADQAATAAHAGEGDVKSVKDVVMSIKELTVAIRDLFGIPALEDEQRMRIAEERLQLDRDRIDNGDALPVIKVVMDDSEDYAG